MSKILILLLLFMNFVGRHYFVDWLDFDCHYFVDIVNCHSFVDIVDCHSFVDIVDCYYLG